MDRSIRVVPLFPVVLAAAMVVVVVAAGSWLPPGTAGEGARVEARATVLPGPGVSLGTVDKVSQADGDGDGAYTPTATGLRPARQEVT